MDRGRYIPVTHTHNHGSIFPAARIVTSKFTRAARGTVPSPSTCRWLVVVEELQEWAPGYCIFPANRASGCWQKASLEKTPPLFLFPLPSFEFELLVVNREPREKWNPGLRSRRRSVVPYEHEWIFVHYATLLRTVYCQHQKSWRVPRGWMRVRAGWVAFFFFGGSSRDRHILNRSRPTAPQSRLLLSCVQSQVESTPPQFR